MEGVFTNTQIPKYSVKKVTLAKVYKHQHYEKNIICSSIRMCC